MRQFPRQLAKLKMRQKSTVINGVDYTDPNEAAEAAASKAIFG